MNMTKMTRTMAMWPVLPMWPRWLRLRRCRNCVCRGGAAIKSCRHSEGDCRLR